VPKGLLVQQVRPTAGHVTIVATPQHPAVPCPSCRRPSRDVHSRYERRLRDLPWQGRPVTLVLRVRRLRCRTASCHRITFCERLPGIAPAAARRSGRLADLQRHLTLAAGAEAGAALAWRLAMPVSPDTLLRLVGQAAQPERPAPRILGVDDWAFRRGRRYGTVLVDLERNRIVDLLPDRQAATLAAWLRRHPGIEVVARDRAGAYAEGIRAGAPQARQVADRWHLLRNLGDTLRTVVERHHPAIRRIAQQIERQTREPPFIGSTCVPTPTAPERRRHSINARQQARYEEAVQAMAAGATAREAAATVGLDVRTLRRWLEVGRAPARDRRCGTSILDPHQAYLEQRWQEGCGNARQLWRELVGRGFGGQPSIVRVWTGRRRKADADRGLVPPSCARPSRRWKMPSLYELIRLLTRDREPISGEEQQLRERVLAEVDGLAVTIGVARRLSDVLRRRSSEPLTEIAAAAQGTGLERLLRGLGRDGAAVQSALELPWTTSPVEGQVNRIKTMKRQMYGRAGFQLLRQRLLLTG